MEYYSAYFWRQEAACGASLVLKHLVYHKNRIPVVLGGIGLAQSHEKADAKELTDGLVEWFYRKGLSFLEKEGGISKELIRNLQGWLERQPRDVTLTAALCIGRSFLLFGFGETKITLLNTGFGRAHCRYVEPKEKTYVLEGEMQEGTGILLATPSFYQHLSEKQLLECLKVKDLQTPQRVQRRMEELGTEAIRQGGQQLVALLLVAC